MPSNQPVYWAPEALRAVAEQAEMLAGYAYVVVEELVDNRVVLMAWPWPQADDEGRLFWPLEGDAEPRETVVEKELLREQMYRPSRLRRAPRLGDVYACAKLGPAWEQPETVTDVRTLFAAPVYDISADAREAAKLAYHGAAAPVRTSTSSNGLDQRLLSEAATRRGRLKAKQLVVAPPARGRP